MHARRRAVGLVAGAAALAAVAAAVPLAASSEMRAPLELEAMFAQASGTIAAPAPPRRDAIASEMAEPVLAHPLDGVAPLEIARMVREEPDKLGSVSLGVPTRGALFGGVQLQPSGHLEPVSPQYAWGTKATIASIERAAADVARQFPDTPKLYVGDISTMRGGALRPHRSHQCGLDADIGYYYATGPAWYEPATADNLDRARTWALMKSLVEGGDVEYIFVDRSVQVLLREHAESIGEDPVLIHNMLQSTERGDTVIRHAYGHISHFHVRFDDPLARESGARLHHYLRAAGKIWLPPARPIRPRRRR